MLKPTANHPCMPMNGHDWLFSTKMLWLLVLFAVLFLMPEAHAQAKLPTSDIKIPGVDANNKNWLQQFSGVISLVIVIGALAAVGFGMMEAIFTLFRTANDARLNGDWGPAMKLIGLIIGIIVFSLLLYYLINTVVLEPLGKLFA